MRNEGSIVGFILFVVWFSWPGVLGQDKIGTNKSFLKQIAASPTNCEDNIAVLDAASKLASSDSLIIAIARLGDRENRKDLNQRRLHNVRMYLTEFTGRDIQSIITAEGKSVQGYGRIELYVNGKHFHSILIMTNLDLAVGECSFEGRGPCIFPREKELFPCVEKGAYRRSRLRKLRAR